MQKALSRRTALTVLGLGTAATIAPEDFSQPVKAGDKEVYFDVARREAHRVRITTALRGLADDIDAGGSHVQAMRLASAVKPDDYLIHTLQIDFVLAGDLPPTS